MCAGKVSALQIRHTHRDNIAVVDFLSDFLWEIDGRHARQQIVHNAVVIGAGRPKVA